MRELFFKQLHELMSNKWDVYFVTGDLGYFFADKIRKDFPERFINAGAAEQAMMGVSIGLALEGKTVFCYSITPFLLFRPMEAIRNYLHHEQIPVILVGSGRGKDYEHDGFSHDASDDYIMNYFKIDKYTDYASLEELIDLNRPVYLNLTR